MAHVLCFPIHKGGSGKTTTVLSVGARLADEGARVLLVDMDPQANLTQGVGCDPDAVKYSVYHVLLNPEHDCRYAVDHSVCSRIELHLIPSTLALAGAEMELAGKVGRELLLRKALLQVRALYDYILIDSPPSLGLFALNAMAAADAAIVPVQMHPYAVKALPQLDATLHLVSEINPGLSIGGVVCTLATRTNLAEAAEVSVRQRYGPKVFETVIPQTIKLAEASGAARTIYDYDPTGKGALAYRALVGEVRGRYGF